MNILRHILRIGNSFIAFITAGVVYSLFIYIPAMRFDLPLSITLIEMSLFSICIFLLMTGGYIINDMIDEDTDAVNKPKVAKLMASLSKSKLINIVIACLLIGTAFAIWGSMRLGQPELALLYPLFFGIVYLYSNYIKGIAIIDNLWIALIIASLPIILLWAERNLYWSFYLKYPGYFNLYFYTFIFLTISMFLTTLIREAIKDIEDLPGDLIANIRTFPVRFGLEAASILTAFYVFLFLFVLFVWIVFIFEYLTILIVLVTILPMLLILSYTVFILLSKDSKNYFALASKLVKILMLWGILHIIMVLVNV